MRIFTKVQYLSKQLWTMMTPVQDLWDKIAIVNTLDLLHKEINTITASLLKMDDKMID